MRALFIHSREDQDMMSFQSPAALGAISQLSVMAFSAGIVIPITVVVVAVMIGAFCDLRGFRLPNWLTFSLLVSGVIWNTLSYGESGILRSGTGIVMSALPLLLLYARGAMGAGDVKLMAGIGAWMGAWFGLHVIIVAGLVGGVAGVVRRVRFGRSANAGIRHFPIEEVARHADRKQYLLPFGLMILCGVLVNLVFPGIQQLTR